MSTQDLAAKVDGPLPLPSSPALARWPARPSPLFARSRASESSHEQPYLASQADPSSSRTERRRYPPPQEEDGVGAGLQAVDAAQPRLQGCVPPTVSRCLVLFASRARRARRGRASAVGRSCASLEGVLAGRRRGAWVWEDWRGVASGEGPLQGRGRPRPAAAGSLNQGARPPAARPAPRPPSSRRPRPVPRRTTSPDRVLSPFRRSVQTPSPRTSTTTPRPSRSRMTPRAATRSTSVASPCLPLRSRLARERRLLTCDALHLLVLASQASSSAMVARP